MISNPEEITDDNPSFPMKKKTTSKKPSARKSLCLFINTFDVKNITAIRRVRSAKSKRRAIKSVCGLWIEKKTERAFKNKQTDKT